MYDGSKTKSRNEVMDKLGDFKNNFQFLAEKHDIVVRELKNKYRHLIKFDLSDDLAGIYDIR